MRWIDADGNDTNESVAIQNNLTAMKLAASLEGKYAAGGGLDYDTDGSFSVKDILAFRKAFE